MKKKIHILLFFFIAGSVFSVTCFSQAYQFTQFYASPTFLNPAFAGAGTCERVTTNYRIQWPSIPGAYRSYLLAFDHALPKHSGIGFLFTNDKAGSGNLRTTSFNAQYSYQMRLSKTWYFNAGAEAGYAQRNYDFNKYIFGDMIAHGTATTVEQPDYLRRGYLDLSSGVVFYSENTWAGFSARHLNQPDQALVTGESRLPILYSAHVGWTLKLRHYGEKGKEYRYLKPAFNYRHEKKFDQVDIGLYTNYSVVVFGAWYRGIPLFKAYKKGYQNNDALCFLVGTTVKRFKFGYSYDLTISRLAGNTGGAHEWSMTYQFCKRTMRSAIPCPKF